MNHAKVFGICENKCLEEVWPKSSTYNKAQVIGMTTERISDTIALLGGQTVNGKIRSASHTFTHISEQFNAITSVTYMLGKYNSEAQIEYDTGWLDSIRSPENIGDYFYSEQFDNTVNVHIHYTSKEEAANYEFVRFKLVTQQKYDSEVGLG